MLMKASADVRAHLALTPELRPFLLRKARLALHGKSLPAHFTVRGLNYAAQGALERLLGTPLARKADGTVSGVLSPRWREPLAWQEVISALGLTREGSATETTETFLTRLTWCVPEAQTLIDALQEMPEVLRFLRIPAHRESWKRKESQGEIECLASIRHEYERGKERDKASVGILNNAIRSKESPLVDIAFPPGRQHQGKLPPQRACP
mgnify:CR=1 FL=1